MNCRGLATLPPLGQLRSLRTLHMRELPSVVRIGHEFYGIEDVAFPSLSILEFDDFPRLCEWSGIADKKSFPCLERLVLMDCPALAHIPSLPRTTSKVTIERTQLVAYMKLAPSSSSSEMLQLDVCTSSAPVMGLLHKEHIESIVALNISGAVQVAAAEELGSLVSLHRLQLSRCGFTNHTFSSFLRSLPCLSSLEIIDLPKITSLPVLEKLKVCTMLKEVCIRNCELLCSVSSLQFFHSLRYLVIERCPKLTSASFPVNFWNFSSLKVLRISYCSELQSLPVSGLAPSIETLDLVGCHPELSRTIKKQ
uniref:Uncharacterized protein n=1 Tax=Arundo donax TaxID=35708 RepID=A0A0A9EU07_ARUDO